MPSGHCVRGSVLAPSEAQLAQEIRVGDIITAFNGKRVGSIEDLSTFVAQMKAGACAEVDVNRNGKAMKLVAQF